jgi:hemerythrin-like domain-containing protein
MDNNIREPTAIEDLGREHGLLNRLLIIYEEIINRIDNNVSFDNMILWNTAMTIKFFIEDYHEKNEEMYIFPILLKHGKETNMVNELIKQHKLSRQITSLIIKTSKLEQTDTNLNMIKSYLSLFVKLYRYHESREDTIIFQMFKELIDPNEYKQISEFFESSEKEKLGAHGFETVLNYVTGLEKQLNIYDLSKITNNTINSFNAINKN